MKKFMLMTAALFFAATVGFAQSPAKISFTNGLMHNFGTFSEDDPVQKCSFTFKNVGGQPLVINQAVASCGCTVPEYTKAPIPPGGTGKIDVTYNGKGKFPGHFRKTITIRTNGKVEMTRLYIEGDMTESKGSKK